MPPKRESKSPVGRRPLNSYMLFVMDERPRVIRENPRFSVTEIGSELGRRWRGLSESAKRVYQERAASQSGGGKKKRSTKKRASTGKGRKKGGGGGGGTGKGGRKKKSTGKGAKKSSTGKGRRKGVRSEQQEKKTVRRRRTPNAYAFFVKEVFNDVRAEGPELTFGEVGRRMGELWQSLSETERLPYQRLANQARIHSYGRPGPVGR